MCRGKCKYQRYRTEVPPSRFECRECGAYVVSSGVGRRRLFCSNRCACTFADRRTRAERAGAYTDRDYGLIDVGRKWGWMCAICGWEVDQSLRFPHPKAGQVDHAWPLSRGGEHTLDNLQLAHAQCNTMKNSRQDPDFFLLYPLTEMLNARTAA